LWERRNLFCLEKTSNPRWKGRNGGDRGRHKIADGPENVAGKGGDEKAENNIYWKGVNIQEKKCDGKGGTLVHSDPERSKNSGSRVAVNQVPFRGGRKGELYVDEVLPMSVFKKIKERAQEFTPAFLDNGTALRKTCVVPMSCEEKNEGRCQWHHKYFWGHTHRG